jgi:hypothetical protein
MTVFFCISSLFIGFIVGLKVMDWRWRYSVNQYGGKEYIERGDVLYKVKKYE